MMSVGKRPYNEDGYGDLCCTRCLMYVFSSPEL
jgi:hypothetical protein